MDMQGKLEDSAREVQTLQQSIVERNAECGRLKENLTEQRNKVCDTVQQSC